MRRVYQPPEEVFARIYGTAIAPMNPLNVRRANDIFRRRDQSELWPIRNKFNVTERAINRLRRQRKKQEFQYVMEYMLALNQEISNIVNDERNW